MPLALTGSLAVAGLLAGWPQRAAVIRLAVPDARIWPDALIPGGLSAVLLGALAARVPGGPVPAGPAGRDLVLAATCWLALCAVPLIFTDLAVSRLPDPLTAAAYAGTAVLLLLTAAAGDQGTGAPAASGYEASWATLLRALLGGLALAGFYLLLMIISPSGMSLGDVKLAASLGTLLAWFGWRALIAGGAAGFLLGGLGGVVLLASRRAGRKQLIPFGPFMIAGTFLAVLIFR